MKNIKSKPTPNPSLDKEGRKKIINVIINKFIY